MDTRTALLLLALLPCAAAAEVPDNQSFIEKSGDMLQFGVPLAALGLTFLLDEPDDNPPAPKAQWSGRPQIAFDYHLNHHPRHDLALAVSRMELTTYSLKYSINEQRPNGGSQSFPSGHTATAFTGAEFIRRTYGWGYGVPAYLAASWVGWSRVATRNHYPRDVYAGAAIGILSNHEVDDLSLPFGTLSVRTGLTFPAAAYALDFDRPLAEAEPSLSGSFMDPAAGLNFELRFW